MSLQACIGSLRCQCLPDPSYGLTSTNSSRNPEKITMARQTTLTKQEMHIHVLEYLSDIPSILRDDQCTPSIGIQLDTGRLVRLMPLNASPSEGIKVGTLLHLRRSRGLKGFIPVCLRYPFGFWTCAPFTDRLHDRLDV